MKTLILLFFMGICVSFGQSTELGGRSNPGYDSQIGIVYKDIPIEGSQYFNEMYVVGNTFVNGRNVRLLMRYNALTDQIEMKDKYQKSFNLLKRKDLEAKFGGKTYKILEYVENGEKKQGYFVPLNEGHVVLLHKPRKAFAQAVKPENGYDEFTPPVYKDISAYYLKIGSQDPVEISLNKRHLLKYLNGNISGLKQFIADNDLRLRTEQEVILLLNYYNAFKKAEKTPHENS